MVTTMSKRGQISVPAVIREQLKLKENQKFAWVVEGQSIYLVPLPDDPIAALHGCLKDLDMPLETLLKERREDRLREDKKYGL